MMRSNSMRSMPVPARAGRVPVAVLLALVLALPVIAAETMTFESLGMPAEGVQNSLSSAIRGGYYAPPVPGAVRALAPEQKRQAVQVLGAFAKTYAGSSEFKKEYGKSYKDQNPSHFGIPSVSMSSVTKSASDKAADKVTGDDKTKDAWKLEKDPKAQLKKRLEAFLTVTGDVDFAATTHSNGGLRYFDTPENEAKPREWKMCYRAGKDVTEEVRAFARSWADELTTK